MNAQIYYQALKEGNPSPLEELAKRAGYSIPFNPLYTDFMTVPSGDSSAIGSEDIRILKEELARTQRRTKDFDKVMAYVNAGYSKYNSLHIIAGLIRQWRSSTYEKSPRADWNERYKDFFVLMKEMEGGAYFVDCWQPKKPVKEQHRKEELIVTKGMFQDNLYGKFDSETKRLIQLHEIRSHWPPLPRAEILSGPNLVWILERIFFGGGIFVTVAGPLKMESVSIWPYAGGAAVLLGELVIHARLYNEIGNGYYKRLGVELGKKAIDSLITEAQLVR